MKISIRASMRPVRGPAPGGNVHPLKWAFERGSELGYDGLELCLGASRNSFAGCWTDGADRMGTDRSTAGRRSWIRQAGVRSAARAMLSMIQACPAMRTMVNDSYR